MERALEEKPKLAEIIAEAEFLEKRQLTQKPSSEAQDSVKGRSSYKGAIL